MHGPRRPASGRCVTFDVEINGTTRPVSVVDRGDGTFQVTVDGAACVAGLAVLDGPRIAVTLDGGDERRVLREMLIVEADRPGELALALGGRSLTVRVSGRGAGRARRPGRSETLTNGIEEIRAPMPGRVVRVLVAAGETVAARQPLVVVEAMKMENELRAPGAARVKDVPAVEGTSVEAGRVLVVLEGLPG